MTKAHLAFLLLLATTLTARAATPADKTAPSAVSAEVVQAIEKVVASLQDALARRDRAALEALVATPFTWVHGSDGRLESREAWLAAAAQGMALSGQRHRRVEHGPALAAYGEPPHTVVRSVRVQLRDSAANRESWLRQTQVFVRSGDDAWQLASGQGTLMYEGPPLDPVLHARYAGRYIIGPNRALTLVWENDALFATFPNGAVSQIFLASPTEEAARTTGAGKLRFTLTPDGSPIAATLVRGDRELWVAKRMPREPAP